MSDCREDPFWKGGTGDSCWHLNKGLWLFQGIARERGWLRENLDYLVIQASWRPWSPKSAATHTKAGVADIKWFLANTDEKIKAGNQCGLLFFHREPPTFDEHGHVIALGCPNRHYSADKQVTSYFQRGMDGLRTEHRFNGPAKMPYITVQDALRRRREAQEREEAEMPTPKEVAAAVLAEKVDGHSLEWHIRVLNEHAAASAARERDTLAELAALKAGLLQ